LLVVSLDLRNFRGYARQRVDLAPGINLVVGENAQGKSNFLEALFALSSTRSVRTHKEAELIRWGETVARLEAVFTPPTTVELAWQQKGSKLARINRQAVRRFSELFALVRMVLFSVEDLELVSGGPALRRRYLDYLLCKIDPIYLDALQHYQEVLRQRNEWLKHPIGGLREVLDEQLATWADPIIQARRRLLDTLDPARFYRDLTGVDTPLTVQYKPSVPDALHLRHALTARTAEEARRQTTLSGPHRDELDILLGDDALRAFGSRGQLRCAALCLRLAEGEAMGQDPIYLLDDCMSELDPPRQAYLWQLLQARRQVVMTGTPDVERHAPTGLTVFDVQDHHLSRRSGP
jgi:DNA replication and repair protein RecF